MASPFIGEIRLFGGLNAPDGWFLCNGALVSISQYSVLYSLIGTTYGGDGVLTFGLPDLRGRVPIHIAAGYPLGTLAGEETVALAAEQIPAHTHNVQCNSAAGNLGVPASNFPAVCPNDPTTGLPKDMLYYAGQTPTTQMASGVIVAAGSSAPHPNIQPFEVINFILAYQGIYPSGD